MSNAQPEAAPSPAPRHQAQVIQLIPRLSREPMKVKLIEGDGWSHTARRTAFILLDGAMEAVAARGTKKCRKAMAAAYDAAERSPGQIELHLLLKARCGICTNQCKGSLL